MNPDSLDVALDLGKWALIVWFIGWGAGITWAFVRRAFELSA